MNSRDIGLSTILAGTWRMAQWEMSAQQRLTWMHQCLEQGVHSFDLADLYGDYLVDGLVGEALALDPSLRQKIKIVDKCGIRLVSNNRPENRIKHYDTSAEHVMASVHNSLKALHTDHLDLLLIHRPDVLMDAQALAQVFLDLKAQGKVLNFGVSNFSTSQFDLLNQYIPLVTNQIEFSPLCLTPLTDGTLDQAQKLKAPPMIWSALAGGRLFKPENQREQEVVAVLQRIAQEKNISVTTLVYAWILKHPSHPQIILGSQRFAAITEAVAALSITLSNQDWYEIWTASTGHEVA